MSEFKYSIGFIALVKWGQLWLCLVKAYSSNAAPQMHASTAWETNKQWRVFGSWYVRYSLYSYAKAHAHMEAGA